MIGFCEFELTLHKGTFSSYLSRIVYGVVGLVSQGMHVTIDVSNIQAYESQTDHLEAGKGDDVT
jgi:uncharacterized membrane protein YuzA (DUF378 family)